MFELYTSSVIWGEQSLERACREASGLGLKRLDLWHVKGWCEHLGAGAAEAGRVLRDHGLSCESLSVYNWPLSEIPKFLEAAADLEATAVITGSPGPEAGVSSFCREIESLAHGAADLGVVLAVENHGRAVVDSTASMEDMCRTLSSPGLGLALAPIHLHNLGEDTAEAVRRLKGRIAVFYAWDWGPKARKNWKDPDDQLVGTGEIDHGPIFKALKETGFPHPLQVFAHGLEHRPPEEATSRLARALDHLKALEAAIPARQLK